MQTLPEEFFMCKSATRQKARGEAAFRGCSLDTPVQSYGQGHLCFCSLTLKLVFILYPKEIEGNCLKLIKGTGKKKKKKVMFPRNIMHNSHIQVCVSSHQLLRTTSFGVTIPGFAFFPTKNKVVVLLGWGAAATTGDMTLLLKIQANLENKYLSHKTMITPLYLNTPLRQGDGTGSLSEGLNSGCTHTSSLAKLSAHTLFCLQ